MFMVAENDIKEIHESMILWKKKFPNSEIYKVNNAGHNYFTECSEKVNPIVSSFVNNG